MKHNWQPISNETDECINCHSLKIKSFYNENMKYLYSDYVMDPCLFSGSDEEIDNFISCNEMIMRGILN